MLIGGPRGDRAHHDMLARHVSALAGSPCLVRTVGVEPTSSGWKPEALATKTKPAFGADCESRTRFFGVALRGTASNTKPALKVVAEGGVEPP